LLLAWAAAGGVALFLALFVLQATMCFWTIESLEMMNILTYGGVETAQYPLGVYRRVFRDLFTYVVPLGCVSYFPVATALGRSSWPTVFGWLAPIAGLAFLAAAALAWRFGVRHYASTGS
jgi:ABC-2 type transport system permease protein